MSLKDWLDNGWLVEHQTSVDEIADLLLIADRDLADCRTPGLSPDWQLNIAYNAALQASTAALAAAGFRPVREAHHFRVLQSLRYTIDATPAIVQQLDLFRKKRNIGGYERVGAASEQEVQEMIALAEHLREAVEQWLDEEHPELL